MNFGRLNFVATALLLSCAVASAGPVTHVLDTTSYNFQLANGGGGAQAVLDKSQPIEIFCNDFANDIYVPVKGYSAFVSTMTSGSDLSETRFGGVSPANWASIANQGSLVDALYINGASDLGRYQMAAYLVSQYNIPGGNNASNNGIQQAIWDILDPKTFSLVYNSNTDSALESAATWYHSTSSAARDTFVANYRIISDATMTACGAGKALCGGFQEQITVVPEPRYLALMLMGLLMAGSAAFRKLRTAQPVKA